MSVVFDFATSNRSGHEPFHGWNLYYYMGESERILSMKKNITFAL